MIPDFLKQDTKIELTSQAFKLLKEDLQNKNINYELDKLNDSELITYINQCKIIMIDNEELVILREKCPELYNKIKEQINFYKYQL